MSRWSNDLITIGKLVLVSRLTNAFLCYNYIHIFTRQNTRNKRKHNRAVLGLYIRPTTVPFPSHNNTAARCVRVHAAVSGHVILVARPRLVERPEWTAVLGVTTLYRWTFNFHKVVRQQNSGAVEDFILPYSAVYRRIQKWKNYGNQSTFAKVIAKIKVARFLWPTV